MDLGQILTSAISSIVGIVVAGQIIRWQYDRAARNAAAGRPIIVPAAIRSTGLRGRWRHGSVNIHRDQIVWTPHLPWGRPFVLDGVSYGSRHTPTGLMRLLLPPATVVVPCRASASSRPAGGGYELAVHSGSVKYLFWAQVTA